MEKDICDFSCFQTTDILQQLEAMKEFSPMERLNWADAHPLWLLNAVENLSSAYKGVI